MLGLVKPIYHLQVREKAPKATGVHSSHGAALSHVSRHHSSSHPQPQPGPLQAPPPPVIPQSSYSLAFSLRQASSAPFLNTFRDAPRRSTSMVSVCLFLSPSQMGPRGGLSPDAVPFGLGPIPPCGHRRLPKQRWLLSPPQSQPWVCWAHGPPQVGAATPALPALHVPMTFSNRLKSQEIGVEEDAGAPASTCEESRCTEARREAPGPHPADLEDLASCTLEVVSQEGAGRGGDAASRTRQGPTVLPGKTPPR